MSISEAGVCDLVTPLNTALHDSFRRYLHTYYVSRYRVSGDPLALYRDSETVCATQTVVKVRGPGCSAPSVTTDNVIITDNVIAADNVITLSPIV